jgi:hypothetical protein
MKISVRPITALSVLITIVLLILQVESASAILRQCRGDPIFFLSDKTKLTVVVEMDTEESNVQEVNYLLHVPPGVDVDRVVFTAGGLGEKETYEVVQDSQEETFTVDTFVTTRMSGVNITVTSTLAPNITGTAVGHEGEHLTVELTGSSLPSKPSLPAKPSHPGKSNR